MRILRYRRFSIVIRRGGRKRSLGIGQFGVLFLVVSFLDPLDSFLHHGDCGFTAGSR